MDFLSVSKVPDLSNCLNNKEAVLFLVPRGFSDVVHVEEDRNSIILNFPHAEEHSSQIKISSRIYNPADNNNLFPKFCLQISEFSNFKVDYFDSHKMYMLNQNQILWLVLYHRFQMYRENNVHYTNLIANDISRLLDYSEYNSYCSYNAIMKSKNVVTIINCWDKSFETPGELIWKRKINSSGEWVSSPIGEFLNPPSLDKKQLTALFRDLPIQAGSESMASESAKFAICDHRKPFYRSVGYGIALSKCPNLLVQHESEFKRSNQFGLPVPKDLDGLYSKIKTIFPNKANLPARLKSHLIADAFKIARNTAPIFKTDIVDFENMSTDGTLIDAIVVFDHMDESGRLIAGEIEASKKISSTLVYKDEIIRGVFSELFVKEGDILKGEHISIGIDEEEEEYILNGNKSVEIISIEENTISDSYKIVARCIRQIGSGRIFSHTGLKGVTKPKPDLGKVTFHLPDGTEKTYNVDLVAGMNAVKAKKNTILLAKAALMFRTNQCGDLPYLDSLNQDQINEVCSKLPMSTWIDQYGNEFKCHAGLVQISVNELSYMYKTVKHQKFMTESGRYLYHGGHKDLCNLIWKNGVDPTEESAVYEFKKILSDKIGFTASEDKIPVFTPKQLKDLNVFSLSDLKYERKPMFPHVSKILDEEYNKGFCIDLRYRNGGVVRFPSAKTLNLFKKHLPSGDWIYPQLLVNISKCIRCCIEEKSNGQADIGFLNDKNGKKPREIDYYMTQVRKVLHSPTNLSSILMKPKIIGVGMKQMCDGNVPQGTIVIMDNRTYSRLHKEAFFDSPEDSPVGKEVSFKGLCIRNPVLWKSQIQSLTIWSKDTFEQHLLSQGIVLEDYLVTKFCKELVIMNTEDAIIQQSDVDGDLMPVLVPKGVEAQKYLNGFSNIHDSYYRGVDGIVKRELDWTMDYRAGEFDSDKELALLDSNSKYQLYDIPMVYSPDNGDTFSKHFINSIIAKNDVGLATYHGWTISTLAEVFFSKCKSGEVLDPRKEQKDRFSPAIIDISIDEINECLHDYSRAIQEFVVRGIKHNASGSSNFEAFLLDNILKPEFNGAIRDVLVNMFKEKRTIVDKFFIMIDWGNSTGFSKSIMEFISLYNKGSLPRANHNEEHFQYIVSNTFYGGLVKDLCEIDKKVIAANNSDFSLPENTTFNKSDRRTVCHEEEMCA